MPDIAYLAIPTPLLIAFLIGLGTIIWAKKFSMVGIGMVILIVLGLDTYLQYHDVATMRVLLAQDQYVQFFHRLFFLADPFKDSILIGLLLTIIVAPHAFGRPNTTESNHLARESIFPIVLALVAFLVSRLSFAATTLLPNIDGYSYLVDAMSLIEGTFSGTLDPRGYFLRYVLTLAFELFGINILPGTIAVFLVGFVTMLIAISLLAYKTHNARWITYGILLEIFSGVSLYYATAIREYFLLANLTLIGSVLLGFPFSQTVRIVGLLVVFIFGYALNPQFLIIAMILVIARFLAHTSFHFDRRKFLQHIILGIGFFLILNILIIAINLGSGKSIAKVIELYGSYLTRIRLVNHSEYLNIFLFLSWSIPGTILLGTLALVGKSITRPLREFVLFQTGFVVLGLLAFTYGIDWIIQTRYIFFIFPSIAIILAIGIFALENTLSDARVGYLLRKTIILGCIILTSHIATFVYAIEDMDYGLNIFYERHYDYSRAMPFVNHILEAPDTLLFTTVGKKDIIRLLRHGEPARDTIITIPPQYGANQDMSLLVSDATADAIFEKNLRKYPRIFFLIDKNAYTGVFQNTITPAIRKQLQGSRLIYHSGHGLMLFMIRGVLH